MRITWYVVGALAVVTALAYAHDTAGTKAVAGTPTPLSIESMRTIADDGCRRPSGFRLGTLQVLHGAVTEVGVTDSQLVVCTVGPQTRTATTVEAGSPGDKYVNGRLGLIDGEVSLEVGRVAPEVAVLEFVLPSGEVTKAELHGEIYLCRIPDRITSVLIRAYDAHGRLLREAVI